jgi:hypothetical protein
MMLKRIRAAVFATILLQISPNAYGYTSTLVGYKIEMARNGAVVMRG